MKRARLASIILVLSMVGCACGTKKEDIASNDAIDDLSRPVGIANEQIQPSAPNNIHAITSTEWPNIDNAKVTRLDFIEQLTSREDQTKSYDLGKVNISTRYDKKDYRTYVSINSHQKFYSDGLCELRCGIADINNDGNNELLVFIWPSMVNAAFGDLHVLSLNSDVDEILTFSGRIGSDIKYAFSATYINIPNDFTFTKNPMVLNYNELCVDVEILNDDNKNFLRFVHDRNNDESAYSYIIWNNKWTVFKQEIIS